jgi:hypothetical protein
MSPPYSRIWPWILSALVVLLIYRRFRRNFGRQLVRPTAMTVRMVMLLVLAVVLSRTALRGAGYAAAEVAGAAAGAALALWCRARQNDGERLFYIPHTVTGIAVSALLLARIVYRLAGLYAAGGFPPSGSMAPDARAGMVKTPLTLGLFFVLIGYYVVYYGRVLWKSKRITPSDLEASAKSPISTPDVSHLAR